MSNQIVCDVCGKKLIPSPAYNYPEKWQTIYFTYNEIMPGQPVNRMHYEKFIPMDLCPKHSLKVDKKDGDSYRLALNKLLDMWVERRAIMDEEDTP